MGRHAHLAWAILPMAPFALGLLLLETLYGISAKEPPFALPPGVPSDTAALQFFNAYILYVTVAFVHVCICLAGIAYVLVKFFELPPSARRRAIAVIGLLTVLLVAANALARLPKDPGALALTYRNICAVVVEAKVMTHLMPPHCKAEGLSPFAYSAVVPYLMGLLVAMIACGQVAAAVTARPDEDLDQADLTERALQVAALVLVTSTVSLMLFYKLPEAVLADEGAQALAAGYGQGMTLFWGACFSLTLLVSFGPVILMGQRKTKAVPVEATMTFDGFRKQLAAYLSVLAPLIVGALGPVFEAITSAL